MMWIFHHGLILYGDGVHGEDQLCYNAVFLLVVDGVTDVGYLRTPPNGSLQIQEKLTYARQEARDKCSVCIEYSRTSI